VPTATHRFLIVRLGSLGDVIHAIPVAAALRNAFPHAHIDWIVDPRYVELLDLVESLDRRIPLAPRTMLQHPGAFFATVGDLRRSGYDAAFDLQGLLKSAVIARAAAAQRTVGFPRAHLREPAAAFFYSDTPDPGAAAHVVHKNLALLGPFGVADLRARFPIRIVQTAAVTTVVQRFGAGRYAVLNPGAAWPNKRWPPERFGAVAHALQRELGIPCVVLWGPGEQPLASAVVAASDGAAALAPPTTVTDLVGLARSAALMVSGDTGPLHIAAAMGTPIVALFGPTRAERNGPWAEADRSLTRTATCSCLYERRCRRPTPCIDEIAVDDVTAAVRQRLGAHG
jgi:lipopolysaccharide heptosyltransferase I